MDTCRQLAHRCTADDMLCGNHRLAAIGFGCRHPPVAIGILRELLKTMTHQHRVAVRHDKVARRVPHHSRSKARIAECFQQCLGFHAVIGFFVQTERPLEPVKDGGTEAQAFDALRCPVGGHFVARHAPHLFGVGFEEDRKQLVTKLVYRPILKAADIFVRKGLGLHIARHAQRRPHNAKVEKCFERAQRIAVEFAFIIDPAHARTLNEVVGQNLVPQIDNVFRLRKKAVAPDIKAISVHFNSAADAADITFVFFNDGNAIPFFCQQIGGS